MSIYEIISLVLTWQNMLALVVGGFVGLWWGSCPGSVLLPAWPCPFL